MKKIIITSILIAIVLLPSLLFAQPAFGDDVNDVPVDGGLSLLIAAGAGYGLNKMKVKKNKK